MDYYKSLILSWSIAIFCCGCNLNESLIITGKIDYVGSSEIYVSKQPTHYKYSDKIRIPIPVTKDNTFELAVPIDSAQTINFHINDQSYPIVGKPGEKVYLDISRSDFPASVQVAGYSAPWDSLYSAYHNRTEKINGKIDSLLPGFRRGKSTPVLNLYKNRYQLARKYFEGTPLEGIFYRTVGEYLVKRLEYIKHRYGQEGFNPEREREEVLNEAGNLNFFSFQSLYAQRAGIRDFTNAFANTFGVADSLEKQYGQKLTQYDIKRLGYRKLDSARTSILQHIKGRKALAYSHMHLIAERIGEMPLDIATPGYKNFIEEYSDFPEYTTFLKNFYNQIKKVSPGQPAIPFVLPDKNGQKVRMKDFRGKYVLLDFWASWCIPCLDEFPHMKKIYNEYSRNQFEIVAISIEKDSLRWRRTLEKFNNPWPQLYGGNEFQQETFRAYRGGGIPFYILVGPDGNIIRYNDIRPSFNLPSILESLITQSK